MKPKLYAANVHFLGSKLRMLRKQSGMTLEDLATRCIQIDTINAPSVSYISLIERGQRTPAPKAGSLAINRIPSSSVGFQKSFLFIPSS